MNDSAIPVDGAAPAVPTLADVGEAARRIAGQARRTPVVTSAAIDRIAGVELAFKCENLQRTGSFKFRGACNAVFALSDEDAAAGVCTHSSGNHGAATALAARLRGIPATVVMPHGATQLKLDAVAEFGGKVHQCEPVFTARDAALDAIRKETGACVIHPFNNFNVIAGQGTAALEFLDAPEPASWCAPLTGPLDAIIAPVGGGGLLSGSAIVAAARGCRIYGAEPAGADDAMRSLHSGKIEPMDAPDTIADGLRSTLGPLTFAVIRAHVEDILTASEESIVAAMRLLWERTNLVVEPSGAVGLAALMEQGAPPGCRRIGIILSGGNVDLDRLPWMK